jgi:hypothetical protein
MSTTFRSLLRRVVPAAALMLAPVAASAQGFSFFGNFGSGPNAGTFAGTLTLGGGFTAGSTGIFSASSLTITQYPGGIVVSPEGNTATSWSLQTANSFTTLNGAITGWQFIASTGSQYDNSSYLLCLNTGSGVGLGPDRVCPQNLNFVGLGGGANFAFNSSGAHGLTFTPTLTPVPEPASVALLLAGASGMVAASVRRRRRAAA